MLIPRQCSSSYLLDIITQDVGLFPIFLVLNDMIHVHPLMLSSDHEYRPVYCRWNRYTSEYSMFIVVGIGTPRNAASFPSIFSFSTRIVLHRDPISCLPYSSRLINCLIRSFHALNDGPIEFVMILRGNMRLVESRSSELFLPSKITVYSWTLFLYCCNYTC